MNREWLNSPAWFPLAGWNACRLENYGAGGIRRRKDHLSDGRVTGADIIAFIEAVCFVPEGRDVGKPLRLHDWQKRELIRIYDNPFGTHRAILSMKRKNAKSTLSGSHPETGIVRGAL